jgi:hypothetical protein
MAEGEFETFEVTYPVRLVRLFQNAPFVYTLGALTGVSITFCPYLLFTLGRGGASFTDWRVLACVALAYLIPFAYVRLGGRVMEAIWKRRSKAKQCS